MTRTTTPGTNGPTSSVQGLGCTGMSDFCAAARPEHGESLAALGLALDLGVTHFDTSDVHGTGRNEELIGGFLRGGRRDEVLPATKFGLDRHAAPGGRDIRGDAAYAGPGRE